MEISVVIPTYNSEETIRECVCSLLQQTHPPLEIIVVDGRSRDSTTRIARGIEGVTVITNETSHSPGSSRNRGAEAAVGDVLFFCDSDCIADSRALKYHVNAYRCRDDIAGVMGAIRNANPGNPVSDFVQREMIASQWSRSLNPDGSVKYLQTGINHFSMYRSEFLKWKFREELLISEPAEFTLRIDGKLKIIFEPRAVVFHHHRTTLKALFEQRKWYGEKFSYSKDYFEESSFQPDSFFFSALRFVSFPEDYLHRAVYEDNRLLCKGCRIQKCKMKKTQLPRQGDSDDYLCRVVCLAFASGILKHRTGLDYVW
jgi:glycosyltransferase involved in cell wall biosynthesis